MPWHKSRHRSGNSLCPDAAVLIPYCHGGAAYPFMAQNLVQDGVHAGGTVANHKVSDWFGGCGQDVAARGGGGLSQTRNLRG